MRASSSALDKRLSTGAPGLEWLLAYQLGFPEASEMISGSSKWCLGPIHVAVGLGTASQSCQPTWDQALQVISRAWWPGNPTLTRLLLEANPLTSTAVAQIVADVPRTGFQMARGLKAKPREVCLACLGDGTSPA